MLVELCGLGTLEGAEVALESGCFLGGVLSSRSSLINAIAIFRDKFLISEYGISMAKRARINRALIFNSRLSPLPQAGFLKCLNNQDWL